MKYFTFLFCLLYASSSWSQVVINEVYPATNQIELKNIGNDVINMIGGQIFDGLQGNMLLDNIIPTECGDFILTPGEITVFTFVTDILESEGQLLLQNVAGSPVSFLQWGGIQSLATFAFSSGIWDDPTAFLPAAGAAQSFQLIDPDDRRSPTGYLRANPTLCDENTGCAITQVDLRALTCDDNQTPSDPTDDFFTFIPYVAGTNIMGNVDLILDEGNLTPSSVPAECTSCIVESSIGTANGEDYALTITANGGDCIFIEVFTAPENCSPDCEILYEQVLNLTCNDNGTSSDPDDDYLEFLFQAWGFNLSESGYYLTFPDGTELGPYTYQNDHLISTQGLWPANMGNFPLIVQDADDATCESTVTIISPGACSEDCSLSPDILNITCNDNGTPTNNMDDFYELELRVSGINTSGFYTASIQPFETDPQTLAYNTLYTFTTAQGSASELEGFGFTFLDAEQPCTGITLNGIFEGPCSDACGFAAVDLLNVQCNNNGTADDPSDDFLTFAVQVAGNNLASEYLISSPNSDIEFSPERGSTATITSFSTNPGSAAEENFYTIILEDATISSCTASETLVNPGTCSEECSLTMELIEISCNNANTPEDTSDDFYQLDLQISGTNTSGFYTASIQPFETESQTLAYNILHQFTTDPGSTSELEGYGFTFLDAESDCTGFTLNGIFENNCVITSTRELIGADQIQLFPNPTNGLLQVSIADDLLKATPVSVSIWNMQSVLLRQEVLQSQVVDLHELPAGTYLIRLQTDRWMNRQMIVKS